MLTDDVRIQRTVLCHFPGTVLSYHAATSTLNGFIWLLFSPFSEGQRLIFHISLEIPFCFVAVDVDPGSFLSVTNQLKQYAVLPLALR